MPGRAVAIPLRPAVFLDRDGVLNRRHWRLVRKPSEIVILPGAAEAAARLSRAGYVLAIATNQEWVGRGYIRRADHDAVMRLVERAIEDAGGKVARSYAALDSSTAKPRPAMLLQAARELDLDLPRSFMVGDNAKDMLAGRAAGCRTVLVDERWRTRLQKAHEHADHVARGLPEAAQWILLHA
jgi:D-glycero-D-manno-heptose 1,7-bisphosphate phosphatase